MSPTAYQLIRDGYVCEPRGMVSVKGKGEMETYLLVAKRGSEHGGGG